jgi:hypothetical protein
MRGAAYTADDELPEQPSTAVATGTPCHRAAAPSADRYATEVCLALHETASARLGPGSAPGCPR